jgi:hypothetical protein
MHRTLLHQQCGAGCVPTNSQTDNSMGHIFMLKNATKQLHHRNADRFHKHVPIKGRLQLSEEYMPYSQGQNDQNVPTVFAKYDKHARKHPAAYIHDKTNLIKAAKEDCNLTKQQHGNTISSPLLS